MIRAIIFDCFGVLTTDGWLPFKIRHFGHDPKLLQEATDINKRADSGLIGSQEFIAEIAKLAGVPTSEAQQALHTNVPNEPLFDLIKSLKPSYKIGMLSNASGDWTSELFTPEQVALLDAVSLSYATGVMKPHPRAYEAIAEQLGYDVSQCIFIDDQERYCTGAREIGMPAIWYQNFEQCQADLQKALSQSGK
jgi:HAD superfamily hydrolase (TIGR01509 family)